MADRPTDKPPKDEHPLARQVGTKAERKLRAQRNVNRTVWLGLGMMGLIGWSVAIPTLLGAALGLWLDRQYPVSFSWTLMLLIIGLIVGCLNAWHWIAREHEEMQVEQDDNNK
ncbi:Sodium-transporting ATPase subunit I [Methanosarcina lacustris Z-7289]|uniref:Sodium-transporting ATPase subunit I n=1 Tax=Methanosarcina lacustris Z-7289 TaxID=1434111 RepID=A0A0E3S2N9_9EURY|nr:AtpZ/AtpI family protein [Methanosarcina lacustris]AKB74401.1 Sodium-transporting ATPase subunit I [Methanosarcina lacustris Z-7289]